MKAVWGIAGLLVTALAALGVVVNLPVPASPSAIPPVSPTNDSVSVVEGICWVEPVSEIRRLSFKLSGVIAKCNVEVGQQVQENEALLTLLDVEERGAVAVAEKELAQALAEQSQLLAGVHPKRVVAAEQFAAALSTRLDFLQRQFTRRADLFAKKVAAEDDLDAIRTDLRENESRLRAAQAELTHLQEFVRDADKLAAEAKVALAQSRLDLARERLQLTRLTAPISGTVLEILKHPGERATLEADESVLLLADLTHLQIRAEVDERYARQVQSGQVARLHGRNLGGQSFTGHVRLSRPLMGPKTVFSRRATERKDLNVRQVIIDPPPEFTAPIGLRLDVSIEAQLQRR